MEEMKPMATKPGNQKPKTKIPSQEHWQKTLGINGVNHKESPRGEATIEKLRLINTPPYEIYVRGLTSLGGLNFINVSGRN